MSNEDKRREADAARAERESAGHAGEVRREADAEVEREAAARHIAALEAAAAGATAARERAEAEQAVAAKRRAEQRAADEAGERAEQQKVDAARTAEDTAHEAVRAARRDGRSDRGPRTAKD